MEVKMRFLSYVSSFLLILQLLSGCTTIQRQLANRDDAVIALKQNDVYVETFNFADLYALNTILKDFHQKYFLGVSYLKVEAKNYVNSDRIDREKRLAKIDCRLNLLNAYIDNLLIYYIDDWEDNKSSLGQLTREIQNFYRESYEKIVGK